MAEPGTNKIFIVIGEESGDQLAASLIDAFKTRNEYKIVWSGLAGTALQKRGVTSLFPLSDLAVMGIGPVLKRLPNLIRRVYQTVDAIIETKPDCIVLIDSPDFTHAVAKRVRARDPSIPIIGWISPSVWAWRQGRAKKWQPISTICSAYYLLNPPFINSLEDRHAPILAIL
jgi:lipid-A-disaccharide synthase